MHAPILATEVSLRVWETALFSRGSVLSVIGHQFSVNPGQDDLRTNDGDLSYS